MVQDFLKTTFILSSISILPQHSLLYRHSITSSIETIALTGKPYFSSISSSAVYSTLYNKDIKYCSNRKEIKDHGDKGILLGSSLKDGDRVYINLRS